MLIEAILVAAIVSGTLLIAYIARLLFMSKCTNCAVDSTGVHVSRDIKNEQRTVSSLRLPIGM